VKDFNVIAETSPVSFQTTPEDPIIKRVETVGKVQPHVKAKIIDSDGNIVKVGRPGEICVAGYLLQKGYAGISVFQDTRAHVTLIVIGMTKNRLRV
jgi:acyl-CoA synthetase (AMP-forming)/AMP-acid ligase II